MGYKVDNAVIMAAGTSSRFAPLSYELPKGLITVRGEILIERQIRQLRDAGISDIIVVTGYMRERFAYLADKYGVRLVHNPEYNVRNNSSSIYAVREYLRNSYICSSDNYFTKNPFEPEAEDAYYSAVYADGQTAEWCMETGDDGYINRVHIGGCDAWYMLGHVFWNEKFTDSFLRILTREYDREDTAAKLWETIYAEHLGELRLRMRKYAPGVIFEFDSLDELRHFDTSYISDTRSQIIACIADKLNCPQAEFDHFDVLKAESGNEAIGFSFRRGGDAYRYIYETKTLTKV